ncbi:hypothetical protein EJ05DRAFT_473121 [Pseudovirgaria hyperparasitica]|uniref:Uncharacterized protein n=1 Tax=Pseudovirgaria hyperparasitica TaxID=470096 RepID=A0A6A6WHB9_9PEZI|nr:uncharacterized protein EJ05DRAFT_473121 [Pseudovirgaria hyperparasitica]KAF2762203.1 hypothetical protein EJ05DRAFT_473121 [Pseudovirgaria hyperparasitica]
MSHRKFSIEERKPGSFNHSHHGPNTEIYTYIASAINIGCAMMSHGDGRRALTKIALDSEANAPPGTSFFNKDKAAASQYVDWFIDNLILKFPTVLVDGHIADVDIMGYHPRGTWHGSVKEFFLSNERGGIHFNASRVYDMVAAARNGKDQRFRDFQFAFATMVVHECGAHLLITSIGGGRKDTPKDMIIPGYRQLPDIGESGRVLEMGLFGGCMEYYRCPKQENGQAGVIHQIDSQAIAWKIDPRVINDACQYKFQFPFRRVGGAIDPKTLQSMGRGVRCQRLDEGQRALLASQKPKPDAWLHIRCKVKLGDVRKVPFRPRILLNSTV